jgi:HSP20 family protein
MTITRFDPFRDFSELNRLFGEVYPRGENRAVPGAWVPPVDIFETESHDLVIKVELPDVNREDVEVTVENSVLTVRGEKKMPADVKEEQFRRVERGYGPFNRSFTLPPSVDASKVTAEHKNGVLTVKLPFKEEARPRTIHIEVAA